MNKKIVIIDYELGNLFSVNQVLANIGLDVTISSKPGVIAEADAIVLPGVGAFKDAMENLNRLDLISPINDVVSQGKPLFGICLGLQLLFGESEEFGSTKGLGLISGSVKKFKSSNEPGSKIRVPQIAWNTINRPEGKSWANTPLSDNTDGSDMYFVHSYYVVPDNSSDILTETVYADLKYSSSILKNNIFACQFHPEKSALEGVKIYKNWAKLNNLQ
jgi:glutamine amidotransferase